MSLFEALARSKVGRKIKGALNREAGVKSPDVEEPGPQTGELKEVRKSLQKLRRKLAKKDEEITFLRTQLVQKGAGYEAGGIKPENVVWIFGTGRSGSTWLSYMMGEMPGHSRWNEPLVGAMLGYFYYERAGHRADKGGRNFILGRAYKETWIEPVRALVLGGAAARFPEWSGDGYVVIKEPHGSIGAPLLMEALPESRMIFLVRDPRDVVASTMDARREGSWRYQRRQNLSDVRAREEADKIAEEPDQIVQTRARGYVQSISSAKQAYDAHQGHKVLVRYEELRADALGTMRRLYSELGIAVDEGELKRAVEAHSWENIPEEEKGPGKIRRKATPGGWQEDLTPEQAKIVEEITAPLLKEFYPDDTP